jgi:hypothetical protein
MKTFFLSITGILIFIFVAGKAQNQGSPDKSTSAVINLKEAENINFDDYFLDKTMRLDYYHTGTSKEEHFAFDQAVSDGKWPGSKTVLIDKLGLGLYFLEISDAASGKLIYSRGFASIFGEWQSTPEADTEWGAFPESVRFPWPKKTVNLVLMKRDAQNNFQLVWKIPVDPDSRQVNPADLKPTHRTYTILENGPASTKVDILILGDGYKLDEMDKFRNDAKRLSEVLMSYEPFKSRKKDFNIRAVETPSEESGVNKPHPGVFKRTPLSVHYGSFDSERYALTYDNQTVRNVAAEVPYDFMIILVNERTYGGGGIYNLYTTVSADNKFADYIMVHEFGHHMGGLADEYYTSAVSYEAPGTQVEPWELNITALKDPANLKWKDLVKPSTPVPTPWNKKEFDEFGYEIQKQRTALRASKAPESEMEDLFMKQKVKEDEFFSKEKYKDDVGAFEGAGYMQYGLYRSQVDCIMYTRHMHYCKVCQRGLEEVIDQYVK